MTAVNALPELRAVFAAKQVLPGEGGCRNAECPIHGGPLFDDDGKRLT